MKPCPNCGESLIEGSLFCMNCGHSLQQAAPPDAAQAQQQPIPTEQTQQVPQVSQAPQAAHQPQQTAQQPAPVAAPAPAAAPVTPTIMPQAQACPNCGAAVAPGTKFCMGCGYSIGQTQPQPVQQQAYGATFQPAPQQTYGAAQQPTTAAAPIPMPAAAQAPAGAPAASPAPEEAGKKKSNWLPIIIIGAAALVVAGIAVTLFLTGIISFGAKPVSTSAYVPSGSYIAYIKDGELNIANPKSQTFFEASNDLLSGETFRRSMLDDYYSMTTLVQMTKNGSRVFYPDRIISDGSYNLFTRTVAGNGKTPGEAVRLDTDIRGEYQVSEDGKNVFYVRGDAQSLYSHNLKERGDRIASDVNMFMINSNGSRLYYSDSESNIYYRNKNSAPEKVDSESRLVGMSPDFATVYYIKDETLYRKKQGETKERISAGVASVIMLYDTGELFYTKELDTDDDKTINVLCYYDGTAETKLGSNLDFRYSLTVSQARPVLVYLINKVNDDDSEYRIAIKNKEYAIDISKTFRSPRLNEDGTKLYYIDDYNETRQYGDLWSADVADDGLKQAAHLYEDVNTYRIISKGAIRYYSELNKAGSAADLYIDGKTVDTDVLINSDVEIAKTGNLLYYTDYNSNRDRGTLNICVGNKPSTVADDVSMFAPLTGSTAAYVVVEGSANSGDLYYYDGSKERKRVDTDVVLIMPVILAGSGRSGPNVPTIW